MNTKLFYIATAAIAFLVTNFVVVDMLSGKKTSEIAAIYDITLINGKSIQTVYNQKRILSPIRGEEEDHWNVNFMIVSTKKTVGLDMPCKLSFKIVTIAYENSSDTDRLTLADNTGGGYYIHNHELTLEMLPDPTTCTITLKVKA